MTNPVHTVADARLANTVNEVVDSESARRMRDTMQFQRQRDLEDWNIQRLTKEMYRGRFIPYTQVYIAVYPDGAMAILNGNHTLEAIWVCGIPQPLAITYQPVADEDEAAKIYTAFDNQKIRSIKDGIRASGHDTGFVNLSTGFRDDAAVGSALRVILQGWCQGQGRNYKLANRLDINDAVPFYRDACMNLSEVMGGCTEEQRKLTKTAPVMAVAIETMRYQVRIAREFWGNFAQDSGLRRGMPEKALLDSLKKHPHGKPIPVSIKVKYCAMAWNAKVKGETRSLFQPARFTFKLLGTPCAKGVIDNG